MYGHPERRRRGSNFGYTKLGARALEIDPLGNTTRYRYDLLSNLIAKVLPNQYDEKTGDGSCYRYEYDAMDHRVSSTDPLGNVFATPYDTAGRLAMEVNPNTYDPATRSGQGIRYEYDTDDRRIKVIYPDGGIRRLKYDAMGNLVKVIEPEQYDAETDDGPGYVYRYDAAGRLEEIVSPDGVVENAMSTICGAWWFKRSPQRAIWPGKPTRPGSGHCMPTTGRDGCWRSGSRCPGRRMGLSSTG